MIQCQGVNGHLTIFLTKSQKWHQAFSGNATKKKDLSCFQTQEMKLHETHPHPFSIFMKMNTGNQTHCKGFSSSVMT